MSPLTQSVVEKDVLRQVRDWLEARRFLYWRNNSQATRVAGGVRAKSSNSGIPDIMGVFPNGHLFAIETKRARGGKTSMEQDVWCEELEKNHVIYVLARSVDDVIKKFSSYGF